MAGHDVIVVGASAGGVDALLQMVRGLPAGLPATILVVCHQPSGKQSALPEVLSRAGPVLAVHARDGEPTYPGQIYVAPPDFHLLVEPGIMRLSHGPRENMHRPAIDPLFRSAARVYGERVIGVILSGSLQDGLAGLLAIRGAGGIAVVQHPDDAAMPIMPQSACDVVGADHVVSAAALGPLLAALVAKPVASEGGLMADPVEKIPERMTEDMAAQARGDNRGSGSV